MDGEEMTPLHYACVCQATTVMTIKVSWRPRRGERSVAREAREHGASPLALSLPQKRSGNGSSIIFSASLVHPL
jgi:hypothetical protein